MSLIALAISVVLPAQQAPQATAAPAPQQNQAVQPGSVVAEGHQRETEQVCRIEPVTGSRFGRRVCRIVVQNDADRAASREMLRQMQGARTPPVN